MLARRAHTRTVRYRRLPRHCLPRHSPGAAIPSAAADAVVAVRRLRLARAVPTAVCTQYCSMYGITAGMSGLGGPCAESLPCAAQVRVCCVRYQFDRAFCPPEQFGQLRREPTCLTAPRDPRMLRAGDVGASPTLPCFGQCATHDLPIFVIFCHRPRSLHRSRDRPRSRMSCRLLVASPCYTCHAAFRLRVDQ